MVPQTPSTGSRMRCNSAIKLCYSLQLLPTLNEKHQLVPVSPVPADKNGQTVSANHKHHHHHQPHHHHHHQPHQQQQQQRITFIIHHLCSHVKDLYRKLVEFVNIDLELQSQDSLHPWYSRLKYFCISYIRTVDNPSEDYFNHSSIHQEQCVQYRRQFLYCQKQCCWWHYQRQHFHCQKHCLQLRRQNQTFLHSWCSHAKSFYQKCTAVTDREHRPQHFPSCRRYKLNSNRRICRSEMQAPQSQSGGSSPSSTRSIFWVLPIFGLATLILYLLTLRLEDEKHDPNFQLKFPKSIEDIQTMLSFLVHMKEKYPYFLLLVFSCAYVYKQTFAIPGSIFLNLLGGALFGPALGFFLACVLSAVGATNCYLMSRLFGKGYVMKYFPEKVEYFHVKVRENRDSLFFFLLFLRLFPMSPNWFMNVVAPIVGIPIHLFFFSVLIGLMPYNFVGVQTGSVLSQISSVSEIFTTAILLKMSLAAIIALVPGIVIKKLHGQPERHGD